MSYDLTAQKITEAVLAQLEKGKVPWRQPWSEISSPFNLRSKKAYRGMNHFLLGCVEDNPSGAFLTFKQGLEVDGKLKKGSKGWPIVFWKMLGEQRDSAGKVDKKGIPLMRYSHVFPITDFDGLDLDKLLPKQDGPLLNVAPNSSAEEVLRHIQPQPRYRVSNGAAYAPLLDVVYMPDIFMFHTNEGYYSTLFHELGHWTGHANRLNREGITNRAARFGSHLYAFEELVAEMTAGLICAHCQIDQPMDQTASYLAGWVSKFKEHPKMLLEASGKASKAADFLLRRLPEVEEITVAAPAAEPQSRPLAMAA